MLKRIPFTAVPVATDGEYQFSIATYIVGLVIFFVGTVLGFYILPKALTLFHWVTWTVALFMWVGFAAYLLAFDPKRLRAFLAAYFSGLGVVLLVATVFGDHLMTEGGGPIIRTLQVLPILGAFGSIVETYFIGAVPDMVVARWSQ